MSWFLKYFWIFILSLRFLDQCLSYFHCLIFCGSIDLFSSASFGAYFFSTAAKCDSSSASFPFVFPAVVSFLFGSDIFLAVLFLNYSLTHSTIKPQKRQSTSAELAIEDVVLGLSMLCPEDILQCQLRQPPFNNSICYKVWTTVVSPTKTYCSSYQYQTKRDCLFLICWWVSEWVSKFSLLFCRQTFFFNECVGIAFWYFK